MSESKPTVMKQIKAIKRRGVETIFQKVGISDGTLDAEYEDMKRRHDRTVRELHELTHGMAVFLDKQRDLFSAGADLADVTYEYYFGRLLVDWPPGTPSALRSHQATSAFKTAWAHCNDAVRRSVAKAWLDHGLIPLRSHVAAIVPEIQREHDLREAYVKDFDSYRRRYNALQDKHAAAAAKDPASKAAGELERHLYQIQSKLTAAEDRYRRQNAKVKEAMLAAKLARDALLEATVLTMATAQAELFRATGETLAGLASHLDEERARPLRDMIQGLIAKGGPEVRPVEMSQMEKVVKTLTGGRATGTGGSPRPEQPVSVQHTHMLPPTSTGDLAASASSSPAPGGFSPTTTTTAAATTTAATAAPVPSKPSSGGGGGMGSGTKLFSNFFSRQGSSSQNNSPAGLADKDALAGTTASGSGSGSVDAAGATTVDLNSTKASSAGEAAPGAAEAATTTSGGSGGGFERTTAAGFATARGATMQMTAAPGDATFRETAGIAAMTSTAASPGPAAAVAYARALYDNEPEDETELGFYVGDVLEILVQDESGWWEARLNGKVGSIPANYVEVIQQP